MKIGQILEAKAAANFDTNLAGSSDLKIKREGDMVWHLYKFFDAGEPIGEEKTNPAYKEYQRDLDRQAWKTLSDWERNIYNTGWEDPKYSEIRDKLNSAYENLEKNFSGHVPPKEATTATVRIYQPKKEYIVLANGVPVKHIKARIKNGVIMNMAFETTDRPVGGKRRSGTSKQFRVKQAHKIPPRELFDIYKKHDY